MRLTPLHRNLIAIMVTMAAVTLTYSLSTPLLSLILDRQGVSGTLIGLSTASQAVAIFAIAPFAPALLRRLGPARLMLAAIGLQLVFFLLLPVFPNVYAWFPLRFAIGAGASVMWVASEAWVNTVIEDRIRGRVLALYSAAVTGGYALGPLVLLAAGSEGWAPFLAGAAILLCAGLATLFGAGVAPAIEGKPSAPLLAYLFLAPLAMLSCAVVAASDGVLAAFLPLYGLAQGLSQDQGLLLLTLIGLGGVALEYPFGWLADRMNRRLLALLLSLGLLAGCLAFPFVVPIPGANWIFIFTFGGCLGALYTLGNVLMGERFQGGDLAAASTLFATMWNVGALVGPPLGGLGRDLAPNFGLPGALTLIFALFLPVPLVTYLKHRRARE
ncbi:MAG: MFS transporter [Kiloniellales bacterium]|nr:MFS transporter [Kiloniellales bacterium]